MRRQAAQYFESTASRWEEFYIGRGKPSVYTMIYRLRLVTALALVDTLHLQSGSRCLDIGCGPGLAAVALAQRGFVVDAVDLVQAQLDRTAQRAAEAGVGEHILTQISDVHSLDFLDSTFDLVLVLGIMEWLEDLRTPLREISRVLKPGGYAVLAVDNKWALRDVLDPFVSPVFAFLRRPVRLLLDWSGAERKRDAAPQTYSRSPRHFDQLMADAGLAREQGRTIGFGPFSLRNLRLPDSLGMPIHRSLQYLADRDVRLLRSAGLVYVVIGRKDGQ